MENLGIGHLASGKHTFSWVKQPDMAIFNSFLYVYQRVLFNTIQRYERYDLWPDPPRKGFEDAKGWDGERVTSLEELL